MKTISSNREMSGNRSENLVEWVLSKSHVG